MNNQKKSGTRCAYSNNLLKNLIVPLLVALLAVVLALAVGFNKGIDYNGGIIVSVMAGEEVNLKDAEEYKEFKSKIDDVLTLNKVSGDVYITELDSTTQNYILTVKVEYNTAGEDIDDLVSDIKSDLVVNFYPQESAEEIENRNLVIVSTFNGSVSNWTVISTVLATLICIIAVSVYIGIRIGVNSGVVSLVVSIFNVALTMALIMVTRVKMYSPTLAVMPFAGALSLALSFLFQRRARRMFRSNEKYEKASNFVLANDAVERDLKTKNVVSVGTIFALLLVGVINASNSIFYISLAFIEAIVVNYYSVMFITPSLFALTFARKFRKAKAKAKEDTNKLSETEVMTETNLDELVSN